MALQRFGLQRSLSPQPCCRILHIEDASGGEFAHRFSRSSRMVSMAFDSPGWSNRTIARNGKPHRKKNMAGVIRLLTLLGLLLAAGSASAQASGTDDGPAWIVNLGTRLWSAQWDSWNVGPTATGVAVGDDRFEVVESMRGGSELAAIPVASIRYGPAFVSVSAMATTDYELHETGTPGGFDVRSSRNERDINLGYVFATGVTLSIGHKQIRQRFGGDEYQWRGPVLGLGANASLGSGWGVYSSFGFGRLKGEFPSVSADAEGKTEFDADYRLAEVGLTHVFQVSTRWLRAVVLNLGYRTQRMGTRNYVLSVTSSAGVRRPNTTGELVDTTQGFVAGIQATF